MNNTNKIKIDNSKGINTCHAPPEENQRQLKSLIQQTKDYSSLNQKFSAMPTHYPSGIDQFLPYEQLDLRNISNIKLTRTADDDEFSQIFKKERQQPTSTSRSIGDKFNFNHQKESISSTLKSLHCQNNVSQTNDQFRSILKDTNLNFTNNSFNQHGKVNYSIDRKDDLIKQSLQDTPQLLKQPYNTNQFLSEKSLFYSKESNNISALPTCQQQPQLQNVILKKSEDSNKKYNLNMKNSLASSPSSYYSPEFGNSQLSFQHKKQNDLLKRNLFCSDAEAENLTLEQFSKYSFSRNPFISNTPIIFEQSQVHVKQVSLNKCENYTFLCPPCFEIANKLSQDSVGSTTGNDWTIKKKKRQQSITHADGFDYKNNVESTYKKVHSTLNFENDKNYFNEIQSVRAKLPCFCKSGVLGYKQFYDKLVEIHFGKIVIENDVKKFYKYLIWKLSAQRKLSIESLFFSIEKRIYLTQKQKFKPFLQQYLVSLRAQNEMSKIQKVANQNTTTANDKSNQPSPSNLFSSLNQVVLYVGEILETSQFYLIELTDTWDSVYKVVYKQPKLSILNNSITEKQTHNRSISLGSHSGSSLSLRDASIRKKLRLSNNQLLEDLIVRKQLKPYMKLRIANIVLSAEQKISVENEDTKIEYTDLIELSINSLQKEMKQETKIGYFNKPFLRTLSSIKPQGGLIPTLDVFILKKYPLLIQYHTSKKIITYCDAMNSQIVRQNNNNDYFFAKFTVCDSLFIYDKSASLSQSPQTELIIKFREPNSYKSILEGQRLRVLNAVCESIDVQNHYSSGYKITLKAFSHNILHQEKFIIKSDLVKCLSFKNLTARSLIQNKVIEDIPTCLTLNYLEALDFDIKIQFRSFSQNSNSIIGEVKYFSDLYACEIITHDAMFKCKVLGALQFQTIHLSNVHFKSLNTQQKKLVFKTSFNSNISL